MAKVIYLLALIIPIFSYPTDVDIKPIVAIKPIALEEKSEPIAYTIELTPYFADEGVKSFTFDGIVTLRFKVNEVGRTSLKLNSNKITYTRIPIVTDLDATNPEIVVVTNTLASLLDTNGVIEFNFDQTLKNGGEYEIKFEYTGLLEDDMSGFYRSSYNEDDKTIWMATTQFQRSGARRAFPCFDEPEYKAVFNIIINKLKTYKVISNTRPIGEPVPLSDIRERVTFKPSPVMSSYLVAFIVAPFVSETGDNDRFGVWGRRDYESQLSYAVDFGVKSLKSLSDWTNFNYYTTGSNLMEKMDMAAIPDFAAGAMENWGLLTYREDRILLDAARTSAKDKQRIAAVIAHEQAHQWFGDLVTCKTWDYVWLNEGFATYFEYFTTDAVETKMFVGKQFPIDNVQRAMVLDATEDTFPMSHSNTPSLIVYQKAGSVIRMMEHYMGSDKFKTGVRSYLSNKQYNAAVPDDLFAELKTAAGAESKVDEYFTEWSTKPGYPVINVESVDDTKVKITQKRFLYRNPDSSVTLDEKLKWNIPLTFTVKGGSFGNTLPANVLEGSKDSLEIETDIADKWIIFNNQQSGFYRVNYDAKLWERIREALHSDNFNGIDELNRAQIVDDILNFARSDLESVDYKTALDIISFIESDSSYFTWSAFFTNAAFLTSRLDAQLVYMYVRNVISKQYASVGFEVGANENQLLTYHRTNILNWACKLNEDCIDKAKSLFKEYKANPVSNPINSNIRQAIFCAAIRNGDKSDYDFLWQQYLAETVASERIPILTALGCWSMKSENGLEVMKQHWKNIIGPNVRSQDKRSAITATYTNTEGNVQYIVDLLIDTYEDIIKDYGQGELVTTINSIIPRLASYDAAYSKLTDFIEGIDILTAGQKDSIEKSKKEHEYNKQWSNKNGPIIKDYITGGASFNISCSLLILVAALLTTFFNNIFV